MGIEVRVSYTKLDVILSDILVFKQVFLLVLGSKFKF
jgi:hypothetical protein